jgi:hypothetical protein
MLLFSFRFIISCFLQNVLPVAGILIPLFGSKAKNKQHLHSRHLAYYLVYESGGVIRVQQGYWDIIGGASGRDLGLIGELTTFLIAGELHSKRLYLQIWPKDLGILIKDRWIREAAYKKIGSSLHCVPLSVQERAFGKFSHKHDTGIVL